MKSPFFSEEHVSFRGAVRQFIEKEVAPHADEWEREEQIPRRIWHLMADNDLLGISYPEEYGGSGADFFYSVVFLEELANSAMGGFVAAVGVHQYMAMSYVNKFGSRFLKENYLGPGIRGEKIGALAITEPNTGSDVAALQTRAVREGDFYIINGSKTFITNGVYGDFIVLAAKTNPKADQSGISLFVVDKNLDGVHTRHLKKIGWHSSDTAELSFEDVKVPVTYLIGEENMGFYYIMECFLLERLVAAITAVAGADYCLRITLNYIHEREVFKKPLAKFQVIRHKLSDLATELEAARQLTYHACWMYNEGIPAVQQCSMAKLYTTELAKKIADACLQYFGGYGYMDDYPISRIYRDARVGTIVGGTSEIMREIIAKLLIDNVEYRKLGRVDSEAAKSPELPRDGKTLYANSEKKELEIDRPVEELLPQNTPAPPEGTELPGQTELTAEPGDPQGNIGEEEHLMDSKTQLRKEEEITEEVAADRSRSKETEIAEMNFMKKKEETEEATIDKSQPKETEIGEMDFMKKKEETEEGIVDKSQPKETEIGEMDFMREKEETEEGIVDKSQPKEPEIAEMNFMREKEEAEEGIVDKNQPKETEIPEVNFMEEEEKPLSTENGQQENLEAGLSKPRTMVDNIIYSLPERFRVGKAGDMNTIVHFKISGNDGGEYTVAIKDGQCMVTSGLAGQPRCVLETSAKTYIDMETGKTNPQIAFMMGKVRISNIPEMMQFTKLFNKLPDT